MRRKFGASSVLLPALEQFHSELQGSVGLGVKTCTSSILIPALELHGSVGLRIEPSNVSLFLLWKVGSELLGKALESFPSSGSVWVEAIRKC